MNVVASGASAVKATRVALRKMAEQRRAGSRGNIYVELAYLGIGLLGSALLMKWALHQIDPNKAARKESKQRLKALRKQMGRSIQPSTAYEEIIAGQLVNPHEIDVMLDDVGGLDDIKDSLEKRVILPLQKPEIFHASLLRQAKGILLYGPPGTGKTMLAKALAKESGAWFINLRPSTLQSKWFGDTQKLVDAVFSFANRIQPAIIFIDEVDALLGKRRDLEHEATTTMKTEFMQAWDGLLTDSRANVLVLGATNRPWDLDDAVLRRFAASYEVKLPGRAEREAILRLNLQKHADEVAFLAACAAEVNDSAPPALPAVDDALLQEEAGPSGVRALEELSGLTEGFSGSDLHDLCKAVAAIPVHEALCGDSGAPPRPIVLEDFKVELQHSRPAREAAAGYREHIERREHAGVGGELDLASLFAVFEAMARMSTAGRAHGRNGDAAPGTARMG